MNAYWRYKIVLLFFVLSSCLIGISFVRDHTKISVAKNVEKPLVVVIPSYNNASRTERNLKSIFMQKNHNNYRVIWIDDASTDNNYEVAAKCVKECGQEHRVKLIKNIMRQGTLANLYYAIHSCEDGEIVLDVDGDDYLKDDQVFVKINEVYQDSDVWMTYGQFETYPGGHLGICEPLPNWVIKKNAFREYKWVTSHLRTFYAGLFKLIRLEDFLDNDDFFKVTSDQAFMHPLLEMAGDHIRFVSRVLYVYDQSNPLNDFKVHLREQLRSERIIRNRAKYQPLEREEIPSFLLAHANI